MLPPSFEPFVKAAPFCVLARAALESLFCPQRLDELFQQTAQTQYTRKLLFSQVVQLMTAVVLRQQPSVHAAYKNRVADITVLRPGRLQQTRQPRTRRLGGSPP